MTELTKQKFEERFRLNANAAIGCASRMDAVVGTLQQLASDTWDHAERIQQELNEARQQLSSADNGVTVLAEKVNEQQREIDSLTEERDELKARLNRLQPRTSPGLLRRLLKGGGA